MKEVTKKVIAKLIDEKDEINVSVYMPTRAAASSEVKKMPIQLKTLLNNVKKKLSENYNLDNREIEKLLKPATDLIGDRVFWQNQRQGLAMFVNNKQFSYYRLPSEVPEMAEVSQFFNLIPLMPEVMFNNYYYVLALSRNHNRVLRCTKGSVKEIDIEGVPDSIQEILKYDESEKSLQYHSSGGTAPIFHGQGVVDDEKREELLQYFRMIDQGLNKYLNLKDKKQKLPLIIMSVKALFPLYKEINTYPYLLEKNVEGNPDDVSSDSIKNSAWDIASEYFHKQLDDINKTYHDLKGTGKTSTDLEDIVSAASFSRVDTLLVKKNIAQYGLFESEENKVLIAEDENEQQNNYDLYNFAAINTVSNGGQVYVLDEDKMPDSEDVVAIYRF
ncbi:MAG: hypothetical protein WCV43_04180 [Candidatus Caldatribacteriota bacterium]|nr:hypothetical protein [Atribacterota bacterium]